MYKENNNLNKKIGFIEVHEMGYPDGRVLINVNSIESLQPVKKDRIFGTWVRCRHWRGSDGIYLKETYDQVKELIYNAL